MFFSRAITDYFPRKPYCPAMLPLHILIECINILDFTEPDVITRVLRQCKLAIRAVMMIDPENEADMRTIMEIVLSKVTSHKFSLQLQFNAMKRIMKMLISYQVMDNRRLLFDDILAMDCDVLLNILFPNTATVVSIGDNQRQCATGLYKTFRILFKHKSTMRESEFKSFLETVMSDTAYKNQLNSCMVSVANKMKCIDVIVNQYTMAFIWEDHFRLPSFILYMEYLCKKYKNKNLPCLHMTWIWKTENTFKHSKMWWLYTLARKNNCEYERHTQASIAALAYPKQLSFKTDPTQHPLITTFALYKKQPDVRDINAPMLIANLKAFIRYMNNETGKYTWSRGDIADYISRHARINIYNNHKQVIVRLINIAILKIKSGTWIDDLDNEEKYTSYVKKYSKSSSSF